MRQFNADERKFIIDKLSGDMRAIQVVYEFMHTFPSFGADIDPNRRETLIYQRIRKMKQLKKSAIAAVKTSEVVDDHELPCLNPQWRIKYLYQMLNEVDPKNHSLRRQILKDIAVESRSNDIQEVQSSGMSEKDKDFLVSLGFEPEKCEIGEFHNGGKYFRDHNGDMHYLDGNFAGRAVMSKTMLRAPKESEDTDEETPESIEDVAVADGVETVTAEKPVADDVNDSQKATDDTDPDNWRDDMKPQDHVGELDYSDLINNPIFVNTNDKDPDE